MTSLLSVQFSQPLNAVSVKTFTKIVLFMSYHYFDSNTVLIARIHDSYLNYRGKTETDRGFEPGPN